MLLPYIFTFPNYSHLKVKLHFLSNVTHVTINKHYLLLTLSLNPQVFVNILVRKTLENSFTNKQILPNRL